MSDSDGGLVYDAGAELACLAGLLAYPQTLPEVSRLIGPGDFAVGRNETLAALLYELGEWDAQRVMSEALARKERHVVDLLRELVGRETVPAHVVHHAGQVRSTARRRRAVEVGTRLVQQAQTLTMPEGEALIEALAGVEALIESTSTRDEIPPTVDEFLAGPTDEEWLVPGLLARPDRVMLTGGWGGGKSELARQIACCLAAGIHPFTFLPIEPRRVLLLDCENATRMLRRKLRRYTDLAERDGRPVKETLFVESRPRGIDLGRPEQEQWLRRLLELTRADVLVTGPLYRLHTQPLDKEEAARDLVRALDEACIRSRAALIIEAHAGHAQEGRQTWRPKGSSLFMAWAHFGIGVMQNRRTADQVDLYNWRGSRDDRAWPESLRRGGEGTWPWVETEPGW